jgi:hypothetical protein
VSNLCLTATLAPPSPEPSGTIPVYHCLGSAPENSFSVGAITCLAREAGRQIEEMEYSGGLGYLFRQTDHKTCALVPLKSYFQGGFPRTSDYNTASDEHTLSFVTHYNTSIASSPSSSLGSSLPGLPMYQLSPDIVFLSRKYQCLGRLRRKQVQTYQKCTRLLIKWSTKLPKL